MAMMKARMTGWMGGGEEGGLSRAGEEEVIHGVRRQVIYISGSSGLGLITIRKIFRLELHKVQAQASCVVTLNKAAIKSRG